MLGGLRLSSGARLKSEFEQYYCAEKDWWEGKHTQCVSVCLALGGSDVRHFTPVVKGPSEGTEAMRVKDELLLGS